jgi:hypothetical protein
MCLSFIVEKGPNAECPLLILHGGARKTRRQSAASSGLFGSASSSKSPRAPRLGDDGCYAGYSDAGLLEWVRSCLELRASGRMPSDYRLDT